MPVKPDKTITRLRLQITGIVQGVGFRPFIFGLAKRYSLTGWIRNTSAGVEIEVEGHGEALAAFEAEIQGNPPPLAKIDSLTTEALAPNGYSTFDIIPSQATPGAFQPIAADVSTCEDCLAELFDPQDRRYRYPFINCTNCGPRYTIINDIPYDRPKTTMAPFAMCEQCNREYGDPLDRRYHAQPVACPVCGPSIWIEIEGCRGAEGEAALQTARSLLVEGKILALKGLGGFHLACDATNPQAVQELRACKLRVDKPFALMMPDLATVTRYCELDPAGVTLLTSRLRPIVILSRTQMLDDPQPGIALDVAPGQNTLGVMLPYTPLHSLLLEISPGFPPALVMTSGNLSEEPIAIHLEEARAKLKPLADAFLMHNRDIRTRCDDSVALVIGQEPYPIRIGRGFAPLGIGLTKSAPPLLAVGGALKNTFCLTRDRYAFLSQHIGELENYETLTAFEAGIDHLEALFRIRPEMIVYDLHPDYLSTRYALERGQEGNLPLLGVQHHHAHIAACLADNRIDEEEPVIGLAFDGTGYGTDGAIWGGEALLANYREFQRAYHLAYTPLPGGDAAVRETARSALSWLRTCGLDWNPELPPFHFLEAEKVNTLAAMMEGGVNCPATSSMGRLFDAVASLIGGCQRANYEAQAAIELEALVDSDETGIYPFQLLESTIDPSPMFRSLVVDILAGEKPGVLAARFHNGLAQLVLDLTMAIRRSAGINRVALSGGVWQNRSLLSKSFHLLTASGFEVLLHRQVPANDGGLALGQAAVAIHTIRG